VYSSYIDVDRSRGKGLDLMSKKAFAAGLPWIERQFCLIVARGVARGAGGHGPRSSIKWIFTGKMTLLGGKACFIQ